MILTSGKTHGSVLHMAASKLITIFDTWDVLTMDVGRFGWWDILTHGDVLTHNTGTF